MIKAVCNSKSYHVQSAGPKEEPSVVYQATFLVNSLATEVPVKFTVHISKVEFDAYEVNKSYTLYDR